MFSAEPAPEPVGGPVQLVGLQPRPGVPHRDLHPVRRRRGRHHDHPVRRGELDRVVQQRVQHDLDRPIRADGLEVAHPVPGQPQPAVLGQRAPRLHPVLDVGVHVQHPQGHRALGPGQREQPVQQRGQPLRLLVRRGLLLHPGRAERDLPGWTAAGAARSAGCAAGGWRRRRTPAAPRRPGSPSRPSGRTTRTGAAAPAGRCRRRSARRPGRPAPRPPPGRCPGRAGAPAAGSSAPPAARPAHRAAARPRAIAPTIVQVCSSAARSASVGEMVTTAPRIRSSTSTGSASTIGCSSHGMSSG